MIKKIINKIRKKENPKNIAIIPLKGMIADNPRHLSFSSVLPALAKIEKIGKKFDAIALIINSPGGSPVQSSLIASRIRYVAEKHKLPVYAFVEDVAASGGYWLACAADEIYGDANSILGSIGVISASFGFTDLIQKIGVQRRVYTSGESKSQLDPFKPENPKDIEKLKMLQNEIHHSFINWVKARRGEKLAQDDSLFTGEFWTADKSIELGLMDGIAHAYPWLKEKFGDKCELKVFTKEQSMLKKFLNRSQFGSSLSDDLLATLKEQETWAKFGL
ncbi:MAG: S49 family peptidase [Alphaproteobacteria bacterium]